MRVCVPFAVLLALATLAGCADTSPIFIAPELRPTRVVADSVARDTIRVARERVRVFLIGDAGAALTDGTDPILTTLRRHLLTPDSIEKVVVFLGDNVYPEGIPPAGTAGRAQAEARLNAQLNAVKDTPARVYFIPGNHDWQHSGPDGLSAVRREEALVEAALGDQGTFVPSNGFPGPVAIRLAKGITMLALDTEWWLTPYARATGEDEEAGYNVIDGSDFLLRLNDLVQEYRDDRLLVVGHHPIVSNGLHAGNVPLSRHLFPLLTASKYAYLPLPVLGSLSVLYTRTFGLSREDLGHPRYLSLRDGLAGVFRQHEGLIYASGHDHSLQLHALDYGGVTFHQIISGSGSPESFAPGGRSALFAAERNGFMILHYYDDGGANLDAIGGTGRALGDTLLKSAHLLPTSDEEAPESEVPDNQLASFVSPQIARVEANQEYDNANLFYRIVAGDGYRKTWGASITVPVLSLQAEGLTPTQRSGGAQTLGLRLKDAQGREWQLRSVDKAPLSALPLSYRFGLARDAAEDLTSAVMPYGSLVADELASAVGVLHPQPRLVWVPDDPHLGRFRRTFARRLMWLEVRPDNDVSDLPGLAGATDVVSVGKFYREIDGDLDHRVDAKAFLRARLLDLFMGDWDRHQDQWRWAAFEPGELDTTLRGDDATQGKVYRPVARDRDWAFNDRDGLLFRLSRPFLPKLQGLQKRYGYIKGLTSNGLPQDQRLFASLTRQDWMDVAHDVQAALTDSVLRTAIYALPVEVQERNFPKMYPVLQARRDALPEAALRWYRLHARMVSVVGSQESEVYRVERQRGDSVRVSVYNRKDDGTAGRRVYRRAFAPAETREVRLWASGGDDVFEVEDEGGGPRIQVRFIGGAGTDVLNDSTDGRGVKVYDERDPRALTVVRAGAHARLRRSGYVPEGAYGFSSQLYDQTLPRVASGYSTGEGLALGVGVKWTHHGFGKTPFAAQHTFDALVRVPKAGLGARYTGLFPAAIGILNLGVDADAQTPSNYRSFYGLGNGTMRDGHQSAEFYQTRIARARVAPYVERNVLDRIRVSAGPTVQFVQARRDSGRFANTALSGANPFDFRGQVYVGGRVGLLAEAVDLPFHPSRGLRFEGKLDGGVGLRVAGYRYLRSTAALTIYTTPPRLPTLTFAGRVGGGTILGAFPFYEALTIGGSENVRGLFAYRYAGRSNFYFNLEPRLRLWRFKAGLFPYGEFGVLGFYDMGRVWYEQHDDGGWHQGMGGGVWGSLASQTSFSATFGKADGRGAARVGFGFFF